MSLGGKVGLAAARNVVAAMVASVAIIAAVGCTTASNKDPRYQRNGIQHGVVSGQFHSRWWNYYERGGSYADGEFWQEAEMDLRQAIALRSTDQLWPRTYGLHFLPEYFPHRELGIVLYHQGKFAAAVEEIERSLSEQHSARAAYYLDESRKHVVADLAGQRPTITLAGSEEVVGNSTARVAGIARSDAFISRVTIGAAIVPVLVSAREVTFDQEVLLSTGVNDVTVTAEDLAGNTAATTLQIVCDVEGPAVSFDGPIVVPGTVSGVASDVSGVHEVRIGGEQVSVRAMEDGRVVFSIELAEVDLTKPIEFVAADTFGNKTAGLLPVSTVQVSRLNGISVFAAATHELRHVGNGLLAFFVGNQLIAVTNAAVPAPADSLKLRFSNLVENRKYFLQEIAVALDIDAGKVIKSATLNGEPLQIVPGRTSQRLARRIQLEPGTNRIEATAVDVDGETSSAAIVIARELMSVEQSAGRLNVAVLGNVWRGNSPLLENEAGLVADEFLRELQVSSRFELMDRSLLPDILTEQELNAALGSREERLALGKLIPAELLLIGRIRRDSSSVEIIAEAVSAETSAFVARADVAGRADTVDQLRQLVGVLALRLIQEFPRVQGQVALVKDDRMFVTNLSNALNVRDSMKLVVFRYGDEIIDPISNVSLGRDTHIVAEGFIRSVDDKKSTAERVQGAVDASDPIQRGDSVVIK